MHLSLPYTRFILLLFLAVLGCNQAKKINTLPQAENCEFSVSFEIKSDEVWQAPDRGQQTRLYLALEMTNLGKVPVRFPIMDKVRVSLQCADGVELMMQGGQNELIPGQPVSDPILPGEKYLLVVHGLLEWNTLDQLNLTLKDDFGSIWHIGPLNSGSCLLRMYYENQAQENKQEPYLWCGNADISPVPIQITY